MEPNLERLRDYLNTKIHSHDVIVFSAPQDIPIRKGLVESVWAFVDNFIVVVDDYLKNVHWTTLVSGTKTKVISVKELDVYKWKTFNLILDLSSYSYTSRVSDDIKLIDYKHLWIIDNSFGYQLSNIANKFNDTFRHIDIDENIIAAYKLQNSNPEVYLIKSELSDDVESEEVIYNTGIPFKEVDETYKSFIKEFVGDAKIKMAMTPLDKYKFLNKRYNFLFKRVAKTKTRYFFAKSHDLYFEIRKYLDYKRLDKVKKICRWTLNHPAIVWVNEIDAETRKTLLINSRNVSYITKQTPENIKEIAQTNFSTGYTDLMIVEEHPTIEAIKESKLVIIGSINTGLTVRVRDLLQKQSIPVVIPYFENTKDDIIIDKLKGVMDCKEITVSELQTIL